MCFRRNSIPCYTILPSLEQLLTKKILSKSKSFGYSWECFEICSFHALTKCPSRLKSYINILYLTTVFLKGLLFKGNIKKTEKSRGWVSSASLESPFSLLLALIKTLWLYTDYIKRPSCISVFPTHINVCMY